MSEPVRRLHVPPPLERPRAFAETLSAAKGKRLLIPLRGHPDPDGIASAIAQAHLATRLGVESTTIGYCHELSHRENRALVKLLGLELRKIKSVKEVGQVDFISLVDAYDVDPWADSAGTWIPFPPRGYMMYDVYDEGAKGNLNSAPYNLLWRILAYDKRSSFYTTSTPYPEDTATGPAGAKDAYFVINQHIARSPIATHNPFWRNPAYAQPQFLTTEHSYYIYDTSGSTSTHKINSENARLLTAYGDTSSYKVNIHYCLLSDQKAVFIAAMSTAKGMTADSAQRIFPDFQKYVLGADRNPGGTGSNIDRHYNSIQEIYNSTPLSTTYLADDRTRLSNANLSDTFSLSSNHYFTIMGTGVLYQGNDTSQETVALRKSIAVVRRSTTSDKAQIVYWRNFWDDAITYFK